MKNCEAPRETHFEDEKSNCQNKTTKKVGSIKKCKVKTSRTIINGANFIREQLKIMKY